MPVVQSEHRDGVDRRTGALVNPQRRRGQQELESVQTVREIGERLEVEIVEGGSLWPIETFRTLSWFNEREDASVSASVAVAARE